MQKAGFNRALKVQDAEKTRSCKPQEVEIVERDVSTHWSRGYVRKHKNLSKKREVYSLVMIPIAKAHTENSCQWLYPTGLSQVGSAQPGFFRSPSYMWHLPTCEGDRGRTGAGDAGANVWLGLAVGLGMGEASSGGEGVFAIRRGPESLNEHRG